MIPRRRIVRADGVSEPSARDCVSAVAEGREAVSESARCEAPEGDGAPWAAQRSGRAARSKARASCAGGGAGRPETAAARTGRRGEDAAAEGLRGAGFELLDRNWRSGRYELDIVALRGGELHFAEVKTRRAEGLTPPEQAATPAKQRAMMRAAAAYVRAHPMEVCDFRFDLLAVDAAADGTVVVRFVPDAFEPHW